MYFTDLPGFLLDLSKKNGFTWSFSRHAGEHQWGLKVKRNPWIFTDVPDLKNKLGFIAVGAFENGFLPMYLIDLQNKLGFVVVFPKWWITSRGSPFFLVDHLIYPSVFNCKWSMSNCLLV